MNFNPYKDTLNMPFFIAEIGINHNGDLKIAKEMIDIAVRTGCSAVKKETLILFTLKSI